MNIRYNKITIFGAYNYKKTVRRSTLLKFKFEVSTRVHSHPYRLLVPLSLLPIFYPTLLNSVHSYYNTTEFHIPSLEHQPNSLSHLLMSPHYSAMFMIVTFKFLTIQLYYSIVR